MLYINDNKILLSHAIYGLIDLDNVVLVLIYGSSAKQMETLPTNNIYAFNEKGEQVWQIQEPIQYSDGIVSYADICLKENGKIVAGSTKGDEYFINIKDGSVEHIKGKRPW
jgi:outer membrane protein assembly factor BamB